MPDVTLLLVRNRAKVDVAWNKFISGKQVPKLLSKSFHG